MSQPASTAVVPFTSYQKRLFALLAVATFFDGFEVYAMPQVLPSLRTGFGLDLSSVGYLFGFVGIGTYVSFLVIRQADVVGRRPILVASIVGYTLASVATAFTQNVYQFALAQLVARVFLHAEVAVCMVYVAEEFPAQRRGYVAGAMQVANVLGSMTVAALMPLMLKTPWGWRFVYVVGVVPLLVGFSTLLTVKETTRFLALRQKVASHDLFSIFRTKHRGRVLLFGVIWISTYLGAYLIPTYYKEYSVAELGFSDAQVAIILTIGAVVALPLAFFTGKILDEVGRRRSAVFIFLVLVASSLAIYNARGIVALTIGAAAVIYSASAVLPLLNAMTTELFPTELRAAGFAWSNAVFGKSVYVFGPVLVGTIASRSSYGVALSMMGLMPLVGLALILSRVPETGKQELEVTSAV